MQFSRRLVPCAVFAFVALAGCGGGSSSSPGGGPPATPVPTLTPPTQTAPVSIAIVIPPGPGASALKRAPKYVSPATAVVQISVNGGAAQSFPVSGGSPCTTPPAGSGTCAVYSVVAPVGTDTFSVSLLDSANHVLSQGSTQATIVANTTNTVNITFAGVVASLTIAIANPNPPQGASARINVSLLPRDAAGYTIVGAPGPLPNITVTDNDGSGATSLFIGTSTACTAGAGNPAPSVVATQNGTGYSPVCLAYNGAALPGGATITATISGVPSASATFAPASGAAPSGAWAYGTPPSRVWALERFDATLNVVTAISGPSTLITGADIGLDADTAHVYVLTSEQSDGTFHINAYPANGSGDIPPSATTSFADPTHAGTPPTGLAVDGKGNAYIADQCTVYRIPLAAGTQTPVPVADCTNVNTQVPELSQKVIVDFQGNVYVDYYNGSRDPSNVHSTIVKYTANANGTLTPVSAIKRTAEIASLGSLNDGSLVGFVFGGTTTTRGIEQFPPSVFVDGQTNTVAPNVIHAGTFGPVTADPANDVFVGTNNGSTLDVFQGNGPNLHGAVNFSPLMLAPARAAGSASPGSVSVQPSSIAVPGGSNTVTVSETGYTSVFTHTDDCSGKATITPSTANGPNATFTVNAGASGGTCTATFYDAAQHSAQLAVGVTATVITGQSKRRSI